MENRKPGFTLIELLVVIAIIGLLSTLSVVALNSARQKSRDAKRIADIKQIQTALELYYNDVNSYPITNDVKSGSELASGTGTSKIIYMNAVPTAPTPVDGDCTPDASGNNTYKYIQTGTNGSSYTLSYCLGAMTGEVPMGPQTATPAGIH